MPNGSLILAAFLVFFFLFLTPVSPQCRTATANECQGSVGFVTGISFVSGGIDIATLERKRLQVIDQFAWKKSDGSCTLCENPLLEGKPLQRLPLAITDWKANISCQQKVQHYATESAISLVEGMTELSIKNDWKKDLNVEVKSSANGQRILVGKDSNLILNIKRISSQDKYIFLLHHVSCSYYKFGINKNKSVSESFRRDVQNLPEKYDHSSKMKYRGLIESYGTHFRTELDLGVRVRILTALPVCRMSLEGITISEMSHCLEIEVGQVIGFNMTKNPDFQKCKEKLGKVTDRWLREEQVRFISGGNVSYRLAFLRTGFMTDPKGWLESAKSEPALLSYSLEPLHTLLDMGDSRREGLRQAVSEYVKENTLWMNCTDPCPPGVQANARGPCSCECPNDNFTNSMCCSQQRGLAKLTVTIQRAEGLWGDYITRSDGYVNVFYQDKVMCTSTVWNNNNPEWNENLDFGVIQLTEGSNNIEVRVWDEDYGWDDDCLGKCILPLNIGDSSNQVCQLGHGRLHYKHHFACGPQLEGPSCWDYTPLQSKNLKTYGQSQWHS